MITLHSYPSSPNGQRAAIMLEELGIEYRVQEVDLMAGGNRKPDYLAISPIGKVPALVEEDADGMTRTVFGSGAILIHLAEEHGRLMPRRPDSRVAALNWLNLAISDLGPSAISLYRLAVLAREQQPYAIKMFKGEAERCWRALDARLGEAEYLAGDEYSVADIAVFPFAAAASAASPELLAPPGLKRWYDATAARPAVQRGMRLPKP